MKYGVIFHYYGEASKQFLGFNLGDPIQSLAVINLYKKMGISDNDILFIDIADLHNYNGEYVLLPICGIALGAFLSVTVPFSSKIIPLFISCNIGTSSFSEPQIQYLRNYAPIGCRDEYTLHILQELQIPCYLSGCLTMTFSHRAVADSQDTIYLVDSPPQLESIIQKQSYKNCKIISSSHFFPFKNIPMNREDAEWYLKKAKNVLYEYCNHASLVITSRLHAAVPCIAMGIPVILATENCSQRFSWIDKILPIYTPERFDEINWYPDPVNCEEIKNILIKNFSFCLQSIYHKYELPYTVSDYFENRCRVQYGSLYYNKISMLKDFLSDDFEFILWGCGVTGESAYQIITELFPKAKMKYAIDQYKTGTFHEIQIQKPDILKPEMQEYIFLTSYNGKEDMIRKMDFLEKEDIKNYIHLGSTCG